MFRIQIPNMSEKFSPGHITTNQPIIFENTIGYELQRFTPTHVYVNALNQVRWRKVLQFTSSFIYFF